MRRTRWGRFYPNGLTPLCRVTLETQMQVTKLARKVIDHMMQTARRTNRGRHSRRDAVLRHRRRRRALSKRRRVLRLAGGFVPVSLDNKSPQRSENLMDLIALDQIMPDPKRGEDHSPMPPAEGYKERGRGKNRGHGRLRAAFGKLGKLFSRKGV